MINWQYNTCRNAYGLWSAYVRTSWIDKKGKARLTVIQSQPARNSQDVNNTQKHALEAVRLKVVHNKELYSG